MEDCVCAVRYLVVTGGSMSGLGKGTAISSMGVVLKAMNIELTAVKIDPYLNVDAGTMSPFEHGEVYVLDDGGEVDLDLGNYERFLDIKLSRDNNITSGKIYQKVIAEERKGSYLGRTVQVVPHVTNEVQAWIKRVSLRFFDKDQKENVEKNSENDEESFEREQNTGEKNICTASRHRHKICLVEVGGTVGDIESSVYLQAIQLLRASVGEENVCVCHLTYVPVLTDGLEQKSKPTQHSVKELCMAGLQPDFIFCRCEQPVCSSVKAKISMFTQVPRECVISLHNVRNIYSVPLLLSEQNVGELLMRRFKIELCQNSIPSTIVDSLSTWERLSRRLDESSTTVRIGIVGKYTGNNTNDTYLSVVKALSHAAIESNLCLQIEWIDSTVLENKGEQDAWNTIKRMDGIICPGGFGDRGVEGKILLANFCRVHKKPYLGICLGLQTAVIDFCRDVLKLDKANSDEFDDSTPHKVVIAMPEHNGDCMGGTMRLGLKKSIVTKPHSLAAKLYDNQTEIFERHRHRYEVNPAYVAQLEKAGLNFVATSPEGNRMEIAELPDHPYFVCTQFHPEFLSRPHKPAPVFLGLLLAATNRLQDRLKGSNSLRSGDVYLKPSRSVSLAQLPK